MKSLKILQTLAKIGKVISLIVFIFSLIGFVGSVISIVCLSVLDGNMLDGIPVTDKIIEVTGFDVSQLISQCIISAVSCACSAVVSKFAEVFFRNEIACGTPFDKKVARELSRLGIIEICVSVINMIISSIVIYASELEVVSEESNLSSVSLGITFLIIACILRASCEKDESKEAV